jgi:septal ring factor EnvC (AmiA/AmiB activator)
MIHQSKGLCHPCEAKQRDNVKADAVELEDLLEESSRELDNAHSLIAQLKERINALDVQLNESIRARKQAIENACVAILTERERGPLVRHRAYKDPLWDRIFAVILDHNFKFGDTANMTRAVSYATQMVYEEAVKVRDAGE